MPVKKGQKKTENRGRPRLSNDKRDLCRRLRVEEKKTFPEISRLTGVNRTTIQTWAQEEGWPNIHAEQQELRTIIKQYSGPAGGSKPKQGWVDGLDLPDIHAKGAKINELAEQLFRWSAMVLVSASRFNLDAVKKIADVSTKIILANDAPQEDRKLTIMVPSVTERYRDPPTESD